MADTQKPLSKGVIFSTSGLGGVLGWIVVHPFNTLAVRMNLQGMKVRLCCCCYTTCSG
jgi:hypothetical protein